MASCVTPLHFGRLVLNQSSSLDPSNLVARPELKTCSSVKPRIKEPSPFDRSRTDHWQQKESGQNDSIACRQTGHDSIWPFSRPFEPHWTTWTSCLVDTSQNSPPPFFTCTGCWKFGHYRIFGIRCQKIQRCVRWKLSIVKSLQTNGQPHLPSPTKYFGVDKELA